MYLFHQPSGIAFCSDLKTGQNCPSLEIAQMNKYFMFHPDTWKNIQNYIDELIRRLRAKGLVGGEPAFIKLTADDLLALKEHLNEVRKGFHYGN